MDIIDIMYGSNICGFTPYTLLEHIENKRYNFVKTGVFFIKNNNKVHNIKCISELYCDNKTNKKVKISSVNNRCFEVHNTFTVSTHGYGYNCANCHKEMANNLLNGKVQLLKKGS